MGGGAFILIAMANGTSEVVDAREQAPAAATEELTLTLTPNPNPNPNPNRNRNPNQAMFVGDPNASLTGGKAIAVPGELQRLRMEIQGDTGLRMEMQGDVGER